MPNIQVTIHYVKLAYLKLSLALVFFAALIFMNGIR